MAGKTRSGLVRGRLAFGASLLLVAALVATLPAMARRAPSSAGAATCPTSPGTAFGQPVWVLGCQIGGQAFTSPTTGTIDGTPVVVDASLSGYVYVVDALTGQEMPGWPQAATLVGNTATAIDSSPAIAYLDGPNAEPSIVVGLGSLYARDQNGGVMAWRADGSVRFKFRTRKTFAEWPHSANVYSNSVFATPAIGDLTGNGQPDIVFGSYDHYVYALNAAGHLLPGFPINRADTIWSSPALADTTGTGKLDIIEGGDASGWRGPGHGGQRCWSGWVSDYRMINNRPHLEWEHCLAEAVWSSPAVTTFGSTPVVVVGTSWASGPGRHTLPAEDEVFAYNARTGQPLKGWPVKAGGPTFGSPAVGPLVNGGATEVVDSSCTSCLHGPSILSAWNEQGRLIWRTHITQHSQVVASPTLVHLDGNVAHNDVLIGNAAGLFVFNAANGRKIDGTATLPINKSCNVGGSPVVAPVAGSPTGYMLFTNCGFSGPGRPANEYLRGYNVPAPNSASPWPMFRGNSSRTGVADPSQLAHVRCAARSGGLRVVGVAGQMSYMGATSACGGLGQKILPAEVAGIASTPNGGGYWIALKDGAVYAFGNARYYGDLRTAARPTGGSDGAPGAPVVGISAAANGQGYFLLAGDGSVFPFGSARFAGAPGRYTASGRPVAIATDRATGGYWVATSTGQVYAYDAPSYGSWLAGHRWPIVGMAPAANGTGYWLVAANGFVHSAGLVPSLGSHFNMKVAGIAAVGDNGYFLVSKMGYVFTFGSARQGGLQSRIRSRIEVAAAAAG